MNSRKKKSSPSKRRSKLPKNDRLIYRYFNGEKQVACDPIRLQMDLLDTPDFAINMQKAQMHVSGEADEAMIAKAADDAFRACVDATRQVFGMKPLDPDTEAGLTDPEVWNELKKFGDWLEALKKKLGLSRIVSRPTESTTSSSTSGDRSPERNGSASTSTGSEPCTDSPALCSSESPPLSAGNHPS